MKRSLLIIIALLFTTAFSFADFEIETDLSVEEQERLQKIIKYQYFGEFLVRAENSQERDYHYTSALKNIKSLKSSLNNTDKQNYILDYFKSLIIETVYEQTKTCFENEELNCFPSTIGKVKEYITLFESTQFYNQMLDMLFLSYLECIKSKKYGITTLGWQGGLESLEEYGKNYDNYDFFLNKLSNYAYSFYYYESAEYKKYYELYEDTKDANMNRRDMYIFLDINSY